MFKYTTKTEISLKRVQIPIKPKNRGRPKSRAQPTENPYFSDSASPRSLNVMDLTTRPKAVGVMERVKSTLSGTNTLAASSPFPHGKTYTLLEVALFTVAFTLSVDSHFLKKF